jgi:uncharacterized protein (UPF0332 family)
MTAELVARAHEELEVARSLTASGFHPQAVSRAYYGAFYAAEAALLARGETRSKHSGVVAGFIQIVVGDGGLDPDAGRLLRSLFDRRNHADYTTEAVSADEASRAVADAARVVDLVATWLG